MFNAGNIKGSVVFTSSPVGWREIPSATQFLMPGTWTVLKRYLSVFSFMFSSDLSLKSFNNGLWSTATIRSLQPRTKYLAFNMKSNS